MDFIQGARRTWKCSAFLAFVDSSELTQSWNGISTIDELGVLGGETKIGVVSETAVPKKLVDLVSGEVACSVRPIWRVARTDWGWGLAFKWKECQQRRFGDSTWSGTLSKWIGVGRLAQYWGRGRS